MDNNGPDFVRSFLDSIPSVKPPRSESKPATKKKYLHNDSPPVFHFFRLRYVISPQSLSKTHIITTLRQCLQAQVTIYIAPIS